MISEGVKKRFLILLVLLAMIQVVVLLGYSWLSIVDTAILSKQSENGVSSSYDAYGVSSKASDTQEMWLPSYGAEDLGVAVSRVRAAVVYITGHRNSSSESNLPPGGPTAPAVAKSLVSDKMGSGIIFNPKGFILTNFHVIAGIDSDDLRVSVFAERSKTYPCEVVAVDAALDLAVIKVDVPYTLSTVNFGDSDKIEVGDTVLAVGCPFNLEQSVTHGIISDVKRTITIERRTYVDLIQTDAVINSGNSGGALIDKNGDVIGINVAIYAPSRVFCGIGFAIPINRAKLMISKTNIRA